MKYFDKIVGLGNFGCSFAQYFSNDKTMLVDSESKWSGNFVAIPLCNSHEAYDSLDVQLPIDWSQQKVLFCICGSGCVSGFSLRLLQQLKEKNNFVSVLYFVPTLLFSPKISKLQHNVVFGVLQEYSRSGKLDDFWIVSEQKMEEIVPQITLFNKFQKIDKFLSTIVENYVFYSNQPVLMGSQPRFSEHFNIGTIGALNIESGEEVEFYPLSNKNNDEFQIPFEKHYIYVVPKMEAESNTDLYREITELFSAKLDGSDDVVTFSVHMSETISQRFSYFVKKTSQIQKSS